METKVTWCSCKKPQILKSLSTYTRPVREYACGRCSKWVRKLQVMKG